MHKKIHTPLSHHYVAEASGCDSEIISNVEKVQQILIKAAEESGATMRAISFQRFPPSGVSGVIMISESHLSIHTWPEFGYAAIDFYASGDLVKPKKGLDYAIKAFMASSFLVTEITRGIEKKRKEFYHSLITWEEEFEE